MHAERFVVAISHNPRKKREMRQLIDASINSIATDLPVFQNKKDIIKFLVGQYSERSLAVFEKIPLFFVSGSDFGDKQNINSLLDFFCSDILAQVGKQAGIRFGNDKDDTNITICALPQISSLCKYETVH
ncbi:hypothetical protein K9L27_03820 [Candidatus Gracilibacteria bacterium]|nr:hypothetical protein [Candidatus Gracilibacteria bacterium]